MGYTLGRFLFIVVGLLLAAPLAAVAKRSKPLILAAGTVDPVQEGGLWERWSKRQGRPGSDGRRHVILQLAETPDARRLNELARRFGPILGYLPRDGYLVKLSPAEESQARGEGWVRWVGPYLPALKLSPRLARDLANGRRRGGGARPSGSGGPGLGWLRSGGAIDGKRGENVEQRGPRGTRAKGTGPYRWERAATERRESGQENLGPEGRSGLGPADDRPMRVHLFVHAGESSVAVASIIRSGGGTILRVREDGGRLEARIPLVLLAPLADLDAVAWIEEAGAITLRNGTTRWVVQSNLQGIASIWEHGLMGEGQVLGQIDGLLDIGHCFFSGAGDPGPNHRKLVGYHGAPGSLVDAHGTHTAGTAVGSRADGSLDTAGMAPHAKLSHTDINLLSGFGAGTANLDELLFQQHRDGARIHTNSWGEDGVTRYTSLAKDIDQFSWENEEDLVVFAASNWSAIQSPENAKHVLAVGASGQAPAQDSHCSGGTGPTADGRRKPEVYAPGCDIVSAKAETTCGIKVADPGGTSFAAPAVAGAATLVRQYFTEGWYPSGKPKTADRFLPSGALLRAMLINSAVDMTGISGYPSDLEGFGRILLDQVLAFSGDTRKLIAHEVRNELGLSTGETDSFCVAVTDGGEPLRLTLAFTDPPGDLSSADPVVNDLNLEILGASGNFFGNVFSGGESQHGGLPDPKNSVEQILVRLPSTGRHTIRVIGHGVRMGRQGYGLVITGALEEVFQGAPESVTATPDGDNRIQLAWQAAPGAGKYEILRSSTGCGQDEEILGTVAETSFLDSTASGGTELHYRVRGMPDGCLGGGATSSCASAITTGNCLLAPRFGGLTSAEDAAVNGCSLSLTWDAAVGRCGAKPRYNIYRSTEAEFQPAATNLIQPCQQRTSFADLYGLADGVSVYYVVRAEDLSVPGGGACGGLEETNLARRQAAPGGPVSAPADWWTAFEGSSDWTAEGGSLWHLTDSNSCIPPGYQSATHAWYYGRDSACDYDEGGQTAGSLISPIIGTINASSVLSFATYREVEFLGGSSVGIDTTTVSVEDVETGQLADLWKLTAADLSEPGWQTTGASLAPFAGKEVRLHFRFDSGDGQNNGFIGWAIDDVRITNVSNRTSCAQVEQPLPKILGPLNPRKVAVNVIYTTPNQTEVRLFSGTELLGQTRSNELGAALIPLSRKLVEGESVHAEALGRKSAPEIVQPDSFVPLRPPTILLALLFCALLPAISFRLRGAAIGRLATQTKPTIRTH